MNDEMFNNLANMLDNSINNSSVNNSTSKNTNINSNDTSHNQRSNNTSNNNFEDNFQNIFSNFNINSNNNSDNNSSSNNGFDFSNIDMATIMKIKNIMSKVNSNKDDPKSNLLTSLKPYLRDSKKEKLDKYMKFMNLTSVIEVFNNIGGDSIK